MTDQSNVVDEFRRSSMNALVARGKKRGMSKDELRSIESLMSALLCFNDTDLPATDDSLVHFVNESFAYSCATYEGRIDPTEFVGGRQDGFEKRYKAAKHRRAGRRAYFKKHASRHGGGKKNSSTQNKSAPQEQVTTQQPARLTLVPPPEQSTSHQPTPKGTRSVRRGGKRGRRQENDDLAGQRTARAARSRRAQGAAWGDSAS